MARPNQSKDWMKVVEAGVTAGLERFQQYRASKPGKLTPRELVLQQRQAIVEEHEQRLERHERRLRRLRSRQIVWTATAAGTSTMGVIGAVTPEPSLLWFGAAGLSGLMAFLAGEKRENLQPPKMPELPELPVEPLPPGSPGVDEAARWARAARRWDDLLPVIDTLHPDAGKQLRGALREVDPALRGLVERLGTLQRTAREMPGTQAAATASRSSVEVAARLREGVEAYEGLVAAAAELIAAPDLQRSVSDVVGPAIVEVQAYAGGLRSAARTFADPDRPGDI